MKSSHQLSFFSWKLILFGLCYFIKSIESHVLIYQSQTNQLLEEFDDWPALFGPNIPPNGLKLIPILGNPQNGCEKMKNAPRETKNVAIIERGPENCSFETKVRNAQKSNFRAVIVYNNEGNELEQMSAKNSNAIEIPSVFVGKTAGIRLQEYIRGPNHGIYVVINDELPFNINTQLILPFSILIGLCFLIMIFYMIYRCVREERRLRQYRLPKSMLKKIPIIKFTKTNDLSYDTCVICLEEFVEGDKLRVLPCKHPYHSHCIDPWLTKNRRVCPVCKRKVFGKDEERRNPNRQSSMDSADTDDDSTPLLRPADNSSTNHGTFSRNTETQTNNSNENAGDEENQMSDDENVLLSHYLHQRGTTRINPFDRTPNVPTRSIWSYPILRFFRPNSSSISINSADTMLNPDVVASLHAAGIVNDDEAAQLLWSPSILPTPIPSANNILNPNLSGSFKDDDDDDDDDEMEAPHQSIYEPIAVATPIDENSRSTRIQNESSNDRNNLTTDPDSVFIQTPSHGGIGVAALPNANSVSDSGGRPLQNQQRDGQSAFWSHFYV